MTVKVEVYRGANPNPAYNNQSKVLKMDEGYWVPLNKGWINSIPDNQALFCRMKIYNEKFLGDVRFPILDKYFLVYKSIADYESGVAVPPVDEMTFPSIEFDSSSWEYAQAWMAKNNDKINEWQTIAEEGISSEPIPGSGGLMTALIPEVLLGPGFIDPNPMGDDDPAPGPHGGLGGVGGGMGGPGGGPFGGLVWPTGPKNKGFAPLPGLGGGLLEGLVGAPPPPSTPQPKPPTDQSPGALAAIASQMGMQSSAGPGSSL